MFPQSASFPGIGPTPGSTALDGPPPSPTPMSPPPGGVEGGAPFSMRGVAGGGEGMPGQIPTVGLPPEVKTGIGQSATAMAALLDSFMQVTPDKMAILTMLKQLLTQYTTEVVADGGGPVSPTATGPAFPGGGIDRGISGPGAI